MKQEPARVPGRGNAKLLVSSLPFSEIPGQSRLFLDYLRDPVSLRKYYPNAVASPADLATFVPQVLAGYQTDREALTAALLRRNTGLGAGEATLANIRLLAEADTVGVVTGQQAGLFTGPLYTIYKALSAIRMAERLNKSGIRAVPVFWIATEDHDFDEVSEAFFVGRNGKTFRAAYRPTSYTQNSAVGLAEIDDTIESVIDEVFAESPDTEFVKDIREMMLLCWGNSATFGEAFGTTLIRLLGRFGLIVIDPLDAEIKRLAAPVYKHAVGKAAEIVDAVGERSRELEAAGYHAQVAVEKNHFPLFWHSDAGQRLALRKRGDGIYRAKGDSREFSLDELSRLAADEPERFSPGVMLRPVVQDFLLPTVCYFGGAAEVAYFAQNSEVYRILERPVTPILHRQSFTVVESKQLRIMDKLDLGIPDLFAGKEKVLLGIAEAGAAADTPKQFADVEEKINIELDRLDGRLSEIDTTLAANLATRRRKIVYHIGALRKKALLAEARRGTTTTQRIDTLFAALLPNGHLQERSLNVFTFLNKFGMNFVDWLYEAVDLDDKDHRVIDV